MRRSRSPLEHAPAGFSVVRVLDAHALGATLLVDRGGAWSLAKRLTARGRGEAEAVRQLQQEAAALSFLAGRGAPRLVVAGEDDLGPYVVMEYLPWPSLRDGPARTQAAAAAFEALARVHDAGVVHGDLSPANVLVAEDASAGAIVDFGLARLPGDAPRPRSPGPEPFRGTVLYAAPEVARGEPFDTRADLFALAASILHTASGLPPRDASGASLLVQAGEADISAWAARAAAGLPAPLSSTLVACVAFDPAARLRHARDVVR